MMKKRLLAAGVMSALLVALTACGAVDPQDAVSKELEIDVSGGSEVSDYDTHSGNGDGVSCVVFSFADDQVAQEIEGDSAWSALPMDQTAQALAYGVSDETSSVGPYLTDDAGEPLLPEVQNGYYRLIDRHSDAGDGQNLLERFSLNLTLALYDTDSNTLYFCKLDT